MAISPFVYRIADRKNIFTSEYIIIFRNISQSFFVPDRQKTDDVSFRSRKSPPAMNGAGFASALPFSSRRHSSGKNGGRAVFPHSHIPVHLGDAEEKGIFPCRCLPLRLKHRSIILIFEGTVERFLPDGHIRF